MNRTQTGPCAWFMMPLIWQINSLIETAQAEYGLPCLFRFFTGLYCPGCGGTRAVKALLSGRIFMSLYFHPFVPYVAAAVGAELVFWIGGRLRPCTKGPSGFSRRLPKWAIGALAVVLVNWIVKNGLLILLGIPMIP